MLLRIPYLAHIGLIVLTTAFPVCRETWLVQLCNILLKRPWWMPSVIKTHERERWKETLMGAKCCLPLQLPEETLENDKGDFASTSCGWCMSVGYPFDKTFFRVPYCVVRCPCWWNFSTHCCILRCRELLTLADAQHFAMTGTDTSPELNKRTMFYSSKHVTTLIFLRGFCAWYWSKCSCWAFLRL